MINTAAISPGAFPPFSTLASVCACVCVCGSALWSVRSNQVSQIYPRGFLRGRGASVGCSEFVCPDIIFVKMSPP